MQIKDEKESKRFSYSVLAICLIIISSLCIIFTIKDYDEESKIIRADVLHYYTYLPITFIEGHIKMSFLSDENGNFDNEKYSEKYKDKYHPLMTDEGQYIVKTTMGMSICYAPFFFVADSYRTLLAWPDSGEAVKGNRNVVAYED